MDHRRPKYYTYADQYKQYANSRFVANPEQRRSVYRRGHEIDQTSDYPTYHQPLFLGENSQLKQRLHNVGLYFYNSASSTIFKRTPKDLGRILLFYLLFYCFIGLFFVALMSPILYFMILDDYPRLTGEQSLLRMNPGLAVLPMNDRFTTLIYYKMGYKHTYRHHVDNLVAYSQWYEADFKVEGSTNYLVDCYKTGETPVDTRASCRQWLNMAGGCNVYQEFGYAEIMPCVLIKLNRIYGWLPDPVDNITGVGVKCQGVYPADRDNIGELCYYDDDMMNLKDGVCKPEMGVFKSYYFPYLRQLNYQSPIVFVEFLNPAKYVIIMVECFAIAKNINVDFQRREGSVRFELFVD